MKVGLLGFGRYRLSLLEGILRAGNIRQEDVMLYDKEPRKLEAFRRMFPDTHLSTSESVLVFGCDVVIIGHLTDDLDRLLKSKEPSILARLSKKVFISLDALIGYSNPNKHQIIHLLNNYGTKVLSGVTAVYIAKQQNKKRKLRAIASKLLKNTGMVIYVDTPKDILRLRIAAGSAVGVMACLLTYLQHLGLSMGYSQVEASEINAHVLRGISRLVDNGLSAQEILDVVVTKGGPTEFLLTSLTNRRIPQLLAKKAQTFMRRKSIYG